MKLTDVELDTLADKLAPRIIAGLQRGALTESELSAAPGQPSAPRKRIHGRLTVEQFAHCIQRSEEFVRRKIRARVIPRNFVDGPPYLIDVRALEKFGVTASQACERLQDFKPRAATPPPAESPQQSAA